MLWEEGDLVEFDGEVYTIGRISTNETDAHPVTRVVYRLDRKFEPSVELIVRKRF